MRSDGLQAQKGGQGKKQAGRKAGGGGTHLARRGGGDHLLLNAVVDLSRKTLWRSTS